MTLVTEYTTKNIVEHVNKFLVEPNCKKIEISDSSAGIEVKVTTLDNNVFSAVIGFDGYKVSITREYPGSGEALKEVLNLVRV